jgi:hypothetical protein
VSWSSSDLDHNINFLNVEDEIIGVDMKISVDEGDCCTGMGLEDM